MPKLLTKSDVYFEHSEWEHVLKNKVNTKIKKNLKNRPRQIVFVVEHNSLLNFIEGTSYGYGTNKLCEVYVKVHSALDFIKELPEFNTVDLSGHYYIFNIHKKFLLMAK